MTKVSVFGQQPTETKELKKIEFVKFLNVNREFIDANIKPSDCDNVQLFSKGSVGKLDVILVFDNSFMCRGIFLGHWNDGLV